MFVEADRVSTTGKVGSGDGIVADGGDTPPSPVTEETYFSPENELRYFGASQYKAFLKCEFAAVQAAHGLTYRTETPALLVGSYVDAYFSDSLDVFAVQHPDIFKRDGTLKTEFLQANDVINRIESDEQFMFAVSGQKQVIMTGEIEGIPFKIKIDSLLADRIVDLKIMRDMEDVYTADEGWLPFWKAWGYHYQGAIYQEIERQNAGRVKGLPFGLAIATKERPEPNIALVEIPQHELDLALQEVRSNVVYFDGLKKGLYKPERCERCPACYSTKGLAGWSVAGVEL